MNREICGECLDPVELCECEKMSKPISRSESDRGREIWNGVSKAASSCPAWVRSQVSEASESAAQRVRMLERVECFDIFTHAQWCGHCKFNVDAKTHHETCEYAALKKEVEELREENYRMREIMMAAYSPRPWVRK